MGGKLLHQLADKRCKNFKTCGKDGGETSGMAKLNHDLFELFNKGKAQLDEGKCDEVAETVKAVNKHMEPCGTDVKTDAAESGAAAAGLGAAAAALMAVAAL